MGGRRRNSVEGHLPSQKDRLESAEKPAVRNKVYYIRIRRAVSYLKFEEVDCVTLRKARSAPRNSVLSQDFGKRKGYIYHIGFWIIELIQTDFTLIS